MKIQYGLKERMPHLTEAINEIVIFHKNLSFLLILFVLWF